MMLSGRGVSSLRGLGFGIRAWVGFWALGSGFRFRVLGFGFRFRGQDLDACLFSDVCRDCVFCHRALHSYRA